MIYLDDRQHDRILNTAVAMDICRILLRELGELESELSVSFVADAEMQELNKTYRSKDAPTDVLSFPMRDAENPKDPILGDLVISIRAAERNATAYEVSLAEEMVRLIAHGVLHLLGYDHEVSETEAQRMFAKQDELLALVPTDQIKLLVK